MDQIDRAQKLFDDGKYEDALSSAKYLRKKIKRFRSAGLEDAGEYSVENIAFKALRRNKYLLKLMGISYIHPNGEAEAYASELCRKGYVDYVLTEDIG